MAVLELNLLNLKCFSTFQIVSVDICKHCDINAKCINQTCLCVEGYYGDGFTCKSKSP